MFKIRLRDTKSIGRWLFSRILSQQTLFYPKMLSTMTKFLQYFQILAWAHARHKAGRGRRGWCIDVFLMFFCV